MLGRWGLGYGAAALKKTIDLLLVCVKSWKGK
jgi:hypothetical protein